MDFAPLLEMLGSPDPVVRDDRGCTELINGLRHGEWDSQLIEIGGALVERFEHPDVQARTFAPLVLATVVERNLVEPDIVRRWRDAFTSWWLGEKDLRGWDDRLGWLHAIAHGADLVRAIGTSPRLTAPETGALLAVVGARVTAQTSYRYAQMEEDRVARAIGRILSREDLAPDDATAWLATVDELFASRGPGPLPVPVANTLAVLRATYVMADRGGATWGTVLADEIAKRLNYAFPAYPALRRPPDAAASEPASAPSK
ncbi:uncharacterized protein DUF2785 [Krasilnikovia cinnamomea]|uniref:Uncharacterized protein DUF2785 n=1 Tax=Krasilnikovia cinnamomea TaxID=349313 RepID=A0A4Q7ZKA4_9ACTN|nr:DUF2785 domain-containing protein [Krasilnikovia cinnamomea]RZU51358.1 uncharacterized protein DUF2785 [Krasilnikovia cinnamomea]